ncbi:hypothetical protein [Thermotoga neapolitana]|uniref:hypothetical protein n=1 Tax=Thermotoga neapolitana TaxID=2337 RepID=UPI001E48A251|nr:hypothetical protein [Thermotoga neapolitana]
MKGVLKVFEFPPFLVLMLSLILNQFGFYPPGIVLKVAQTIKNANAFLVFFLVGYYLSFKSVFRKARLIAVAGVVKYLLGFIVSFFAVRMFTLSSFEKMNLFLSPLLPSAIMTLVYSIEKDYDSELASGLITFSTIVSSAIILLTDRFWG